MILDTNALSALLAGEQAVVDLLWNAKELSIPVIVLGEYRFGLTQSKRAKRIQAVLDELEAQSAVLVVDSGSARHYAKVRSELKAKGRPIPENDVWIAALCRQHRLPLVSRDTHFDHVTRLKRLSW